VGWAQAEHDQGCKNVHGKVTVVTGEGISVNDKLYKVGKSTRITKGDKVVKLSQIAAGDIVCVDIRGKNDIGGGEIAAVSILSATDPVPTREYVREKEVVRTVAHDKSCAHLHGRVTRIDDSTLIVEGKPYVCQETTRLLKSGQTIKVETIKAGDFVCLNAGDDNNPEHKVTTVTVLSASEAAPFESREIIREREKIREEK
jgi:N-dimethylarginine dimethylaminohydrolase